MSTIKIKVELGDVVLEVEKENYRDQWVDACKSRIEGGGNPDGEIPDDFVLECVEQGLEEGDTFADELSEAPIGRMAIVTA